MFHISSYQSACYQHRVESVGVLTQRTRELYIDLLKCTFVLLCLRLCVSGQHNIRGVREVAEHGQGLGGVGTSTLDFLQQQFADEHDQSRNTACTQRWSISK